MKMPNPSKLLDDDAQVFAGAGHGLVWWFDEYNEEFDFDFDDWEG